MPPILNPAPPWQLDRSDYLILWHGCTVLDKNGVEKNGIDLNRCRVDTDFGRGFYTTTLERQARHWAWERYYDWRARNPRGTGNQAVVLRFRVPRYGRHGMDTLASLAFILGTYDDEDYWSLVQHCRQSVPGDKKRGIKEDVRRADGTRLYLDLWRPSGSNASP